MTTDESIKAFLIRNPDATADEIVRGVNGNGVTVRARLSKLEASGVVIPTGKKSRVVPMTQWGRTYRVSGETPWHRFCFGGWKS